MSTTKILLNLFHPDLSQSRGNRILLDAVAELPNITVRDLYAEYPNFQIDVTKEQELLVEHGLIVFQHPFYWYSAPALFKEWLDRVFTQGFAFPPGTGDSLNGKSWWTVLTTGGAQAAYRSGGFNQYTISELLRPFQQTANLAGMTWLPPFVVHGVLPPGIEGFERTSDEEIAQKASQYRQQLKHLS